MKLTEFAERGSIKEKLAWTFKLYDKDMSGGGDTFSVDNEVIEGLLQQGTITAKEMLEVIGTVITMEGLNKVKIYSNCAKICELFSLYI